ncbi:MAG: flavin reductase family protein [Calditrichaeota bacterium]|nr:flavin reductase family protein [Calditrichota bacterium]
MRRFTIDRSEIIPKKLLLPPIDIWANQWLLLTSGDFKTGKFNTMTVAWGSFGEMWNKPFAQVVVRPTRHTFEFMEKFDTFTLTAFPEKYRNALSLLGTKSGRDGDKIKEAGLTPIESKKVAAPTFAEAELVIECRKIYWQDFDPSHFWDKGIEKNYPLKDYHRIYFGEIVSVQATERYVDLRENEERDEKI